MRSAVLLSIALTLKAQSPPAAAALEGTVVNFVTTSPLVGVRVTASGTGVKGSAAQTGAGGRFRIDLSPGVYRIAAEADGYVKAVYEAPVSVGPGETKTSVDFKIIPLGALAGVVLDRDNQPMPGVEVVALAPVCINGIKQYSERGTSRSVKNGRYRIDGLAAGNYFVSARFDTATEPDANGEKYVPTYFPGGKDLRSAVAVSVRDGVSAEAINIKPEKARLATIKGKMINATGVAGRPTIATLLPRASMTVGPRRTYTLLPGSSEFVFPDVPPGEYFLNVEVHADDLRATNGRFGFQGRQFVTVGSDPLDNIVITVDRGIDLPGELVVEDGAIPDLTVMEFRVPVADLEARTVGYPPKGPVGADGHFTVRATARERHVGNVVGVPPRFYIKSFTSGAQDLLTTELDLTPGIASPLRIVLSGKPALVTGTVTDRDQRPFAKATIAFVPQEQSALRTQVRYFRNAESGPDGRFAIRNVTPGDYLLYAFDKIEEGAWLDAEFRAPYSARALKVTLREGGASLVDLTVIETH